MVNCPVDYQICKLVLVSLPKNSPSVRRGYLLDAIPAIALGLRLCCREDLATNNASLEGGNDILCGLHFEVQEDSIICTLPLSLGSVRVKTPLRNWQRGEYSQCDEYWKSPPLSREEELIFKYLLSTLRRESGPSCIEVALIIEDNQLNLVVRYEPNDGPLINTLGTISENVLNGFKVCSNSCHNNCGPAP